MDAYWEQSVLTGQHALSGGMNTYWEQAHLSVRLFNQHPDSWCKILGSSGFQPTLCADTWCGSGPERAGLRLGWGLQRSQSNWSASTAGTFAAMFL